MTDSTTRPIASAPVRPLRPTRTPIDTGAAAGALAALVMLAVQLVWRVEWSKAGVPAFPEIIVAAVSRLTPLSLFGAVTENYGSLAKQTLFVAVLLGIIAAGYQAGLSATGLARRFGSGIGARLLAGVAVAAALFLVVFLFVTPVAHLGIFAIDSASTGAILLQNIVSFAVFGLTWALLATPASTAPATERATSADSTRRALLRQGIGLASLAAVGGFTWRLIRPQSSVDPATSQQAAAEIAARARASQSVAAPAPTSAALPKLNQAEAPAAETAQPAAATTELFARLDTDGHLTPVLTATSDFYHVSKNISDPRVGSNGWTLKLTGLVERPLTLTYADLVRRATVKKITTLCCISNELNGDLIGTAEWTGVPLQSLLTEVGVRPEAIDLKFRCADDYEDSIPVARGMDPDTLVVIAMNGAPLPEDHGAPARLIVPGIYGMKNVKWVEEIEAVDEDFQGYWQTRGWNDAAPNQIWARIDLPGDGDTVRAGRAVAAGVASAGDRGIKRVEVSLDDGDTWADATLEPGINPPFTWIRWAFPFEATAGKHKMQVRATDGEGTVASEDRQPPLPDGATGWSTRTVKVTG